jgi:hypothetical protein
MLTQNDRNAIRTMIQEELKLALCRKITIERGPRAQGDPEKVVREEEWNVLDFMAIYMPKIEGALRGMQEDVDHAKNTVATTEAKIDTIGAVLINMEKAAKMLASASDRFRLLKPEDVLKLASGG